MAVYTTFSNAPEIGFGSATANPQLDIVEMGFGAVEFIEYELNGDTFRFRNQEEAGHGDPIVDMHFEIRKDKDKDKLSDHGGEVIELGGQFSQLWDFLRVPEPRELQPIGPFSFEFRGAADDVRTQGLKYLCYSGVPSFGQQTYTNVQQNRLHLTTPAMKKGRYDLVIKYQWREYVFPEQFEVIHRLRFDRTMTIRKNIPPYLKTGERYDDYTPSLDFKKRDESKIAVLTDAMGSSMNSLYDSSYTVVVRDYYRGGVNLDVETTLGFPDSGTIKVGQYDMTYTGKTNTRFVGVSFSQEIDHIRPNVRVYQSHSDFSYIENFYKVMNNGFFKPSYNITEESFLKAFNVVEYGERPSEQVIFRYMYELFRHMNLVKSVNISGNNVSAPNDGSTWNCSHVQRLCKIDGAFYFIMEDTIDTNGGLVLDHIGSTYWNSTLLRGDNGFVADEYEIEILPWWIDRDDSGRFEIVFERTVFLNMTGYIDKDYIDFNIFIDGIDVSQREGNNLNLGLLVPAGIHDKIKLERRCDSLFGTYYSQASAPDGLYVQALRSFL